MAQVFVVVLAQEDTDIAGQTGPVDFNRGRQACRAIGGHQA